MVVPPPTSCCDHRKGDAPALVEQPKVGARIVLAHVSGKMGEVEFDRSSATSLEVYEDRTVFRTKHIPWVRLAVQQLLGGTSVTDRSPQVLQGVAEKFAICFGERRSVIPAADQAFSFRDSISEVRSRHIDLPHSDTHALEGVRVVR
jgi:hypothetical protein